MAQDAAAPPALSPSPAVVLAVGELLVDIMWDTARPGGASLAAGGAPANVAVGLARLGMPVRLVARVGADPVGRWLVAATAAEGVDVRYVAFDPTRPTTMSMVGRHPGGPADFQLYWDGTASAALGTDALPPAIWADVAAAYGGGVLLARPRGARLLAAYFATARARGILTVFDPNVRLALWPDRTRLARLLQRTAACATVLKVSAEEVAWFEPAGGRPEALLDLGPSLVAVTRGEAGATLLTRRGSVTVPAPRVAVVSTVGAGDAFVAALLAALWRLGIRDRQALDTADPAALARAGRYAVAAAALSCRAEGATAALPRSDELTL
jgi:fructokinase